MQDRSPTTSRHTGPEALPLTCIETFPCTATTASGVSASCVRLYVPGHDGSDGGRLLVKGSPGTDIVSYIAAASPEVLEVLGERLAVAGSLYIDLDQGQAWTGIGADTSPDTVKLVEALSTIASFPVKTVASDGPEGIVSIVLAGGRGSRMRSRDTHKVCFPIAGRPAINRLLDQLEAAGVHRHIVVVGEKGGQVVREVSEIRDNVTFVYQINQNGTGNAAKQAAYLLHAGGYSGNVLIVPGDKVLEQSALERLKKNFTDSGTDFALMTAEKSLWPDSGRIILDGRGRPVDIVEKRDVQKMLLAGRLRALKREKPRTGSRRMLDMILEEIPSPSKARLMFPDLMTLLEEGRAVSRERIETLVPEQAALYTFPGDGVRIDGDELEARADTINASVYLISAEALYRSVFNLGSDNAQNEEYLTDTVRVLARDTERDWKMIPVPVRDQYEVMAFNNPEELLKIEEYYQRREAPRDDDERRYGRIDTAGRESSLRPVTEWLALISDFGPAVRRRFTEIYGDDDTAKYRGAYIRSIEKFIRVYGRNHKVVIARSPGRVNLMGRHVDHRGGICNYMTINREAILVAGVREDDIIQLHNVDSAAFRPRTFSIGDELSRLPWDQWLNIIDSKTVLDIIQSSRGDWVNYFKAAALRIQEMHKGRLVYGFNGVLLSDVPLAAGLSSSSAVVVSAAEVLTFINGFSMVPKDFVDICGESEWFVGTRGGSGDHAAMKFGEKGKIIHIGFHDIRVLGMYPFPDDCRLVILQSHQKAKKSEGAMQIYNEKVAGYEVAQALFHAKYPQYRDRVRYLRDINPDTLGVQPHEIYDILLSIPDAVSRDEVMAVIDKRDRERMERVFSSHDEPAGGYEARRIALFGLAEIERAEAIAALFRRGDVEVAGRLMNISHDGDRVTRLSSGELREPYDNSAPDSRISDLRARLARGDKSASLHLQPGGYGCSTPLIDEMVDIALGVRGVLGAQLSGAGLGGCIMALVRNESVDEFLTVMKQSFYEPRGLEENMLVCSPIAGSGIVTL